MVWVVGLRPRRRMFLMNSGVSGNGDSRKSLRSTAKLFTFHLPNSLKRINRQKQTFHLALHWMQEGSGSLVRSASNNLGCVHTESDRMTYKVNGITQIDACLRFIASSVNTCRVFPAKHLLNIIIRQVLTLDLFREHCVTLLLGVWTRSRVLYICVPIYQLNIYFSEDSSFKEYTDRNSAIQQLLLWSHNASSVEHKGAAWTSGGRKDPSRMTKKTQLS